MLEREQKGRECGLKYVMFTPAERYLGVEKRTPIGTAKYVDGGRRMECGSDDPLGTNYIKPIMFHYGGSTVTIL
jgi:hypothetical protein